MQEWRIESPRSLDLEGVQRLQVRLVGGSIDVVGRTEDADLGMRLYKQKWTTAVIDSTTFEEANSELYNWIRQRSRWVKGYIQTYLVHMRDPWRLYRQIGLKAFISFQFVVGGTFFGYLVNPLYWLLTVGWFLFQWGIIKEIFPAPIFYLGSIGGPAARLAKDCITKVDVLEYPELGMEAVWKIEVRDFPAFIVVDDKGNDFFAEVSKPVAMR